MHGVEHASEPLTQGNTRRIVGRGWGAAREQHGVRPHQLAQPRKLGAGGSGQLQHRRALARRQIAQRQRQPQLVVAIAVGEELRPALRRAERPQQGGAGAALAHRSDDGDPVRAQRAQALGGEIVQGGAGVSDTDDGDAGGPAVAVLGSRSQSTPAAPRATASAMKAWPSPVALRSATNSSPGEAVRLS